MNDIEAFSTTTGKTYKNWDALVEAEANGYVAVVILSDGKQSWPWINGPYVDKPEAERARVRLRNQCKRELKVDPSLKGCSFKCFVRPAWKDPR